ncbi:MAG: DUF1580 domain-containing protein [Phycisphaerales bacterium]
MISVSTETLLTLADVPARLPKRPGGKKLHISAVYRWIRGGISGVVLEAVKIGGTTYTSIEALQRFAQRLSGAKAVAIVSAGTSGTRCALGASLAIEQMLRPKRPRRK